MSRMTKNTNPVFLVTENGSNPEFPENSPWRNSTISISDLPKAERTTTWENVPSENVTNEHVSNEHVPNEHVPNPGPPDYHPLEHSETVKPQIFEKPQIYEIPMEYESEKTDNPEKPYFIGNDPPQPGSVYVISEQDTQNVISNNGGGIVLTKFNGTALNTQRWVCHQSIGWLGFTNDSGTSTVYFGHESKGNMICTATRHNTWEHICVRKREGPGFDILVRHWDGLQPLGHKGTHLGKRDVPDTWWGFTKVG
ncbi:hypothetical protein ABW20_dc0102914 [Dactylellina cionopaga]|nr:hypothetical protein ABW20_dc0102914 [Dactylellina cionopaga]